MFNKTEFLLFPSSQQRPNRPSSPFEMRAFPGLCTLLLLSITAAAVPAWGRRERESGFDTRPDHENSGGHRRIEPRRERKDEPGSDIPLHHRDHVLVHNDGVLETGAVIEDCLRGAVKDGIKDKSLMGAACGCGEKVVEGFQERRLRDAEKQRQDSDKRTIRAERSDDRRGRDFSGRGHTGVDYNPRADSPTRSTA